MFFDRTEVFMTMELARYARAKEILDGKGIPYTVRTKSSGGYSANSHRMGNFGEKFEHSLTYYIYTKKEHAERAKHFIYSGLHG